jgi:serine/threonine protein kinase
MAEFEALEIIGRGSFGQIRKVRRISDGQILVRKEISYNSMNQKEKAQLIAEFRILKSLVHPNIVQYLHHEHLVDEHMVYLYMEYCGGGDLAGLIRQCRETGTLVPEKIVWSIFTQLILALYRCHLNCDPPPPGDPFYSDSDVPSPIPNGGTVILHRDIKPDNVFLDDNHSVRLGDFGLAKMLDQEHLFARTYVGTPFYMSPEVLMDQPSTPRSDIWSLGCVIYELCALHPPFQAKTHLSLSQKIREGVFPPVPECYSSTLSKTIAACLNTNPLLRPETSTLLTLDIINLCRRNRQLMEKERTLMNIEEQLKKHELMLIGREQQWTREIEIKAHRIEQDIYNRLESELASAIEREVDRRVEIILKERTAATAAAPMSPVDTSMLSPSSPTQSRNVRGPRSIRDNIISPLRDMSSNQHYLTSSPLATQSTKTTTTSNLSSSPSSDPTANWITTKKEPQRAAPHYQAITTQLGIGAAAAQARVMGIRGPAGSLGRAAVQIQRENQDGHLWDESVQEDMPSPFLKRWERKTVG